MTGTTAPATGSFATASGFINGSGVTKADGDGDRYLRIFAEDNAGNTIITGSQAFNFDNTSPTVTNITYSPRTSTYGNVIVQVTFDEMVLPVSGRTIDASGTTLTRTYLWNTEEILEVFDPSGNTGTANIIITRIKKNSG
jgi:hypothetical protein